MTTARSLQAEWVRRPGSGGHDDRLLLEVLLERSGRELAPETRLLEAAEGHARERRIRHVEADRAGVDAARQALGAVGVAGPHRGHQAVAHAVCDPDGLALVLERRDRHDRPEDIILG